MIRPQWIIGFDEAYDLVEALRTELEGFDALGEESPAQHGYLFSRALRTEEGISVDGVGEWERADALRRDIDLKYQQFIRLDELTDEQRIIEVDVFYPIREGRVESQSLLTLFHLFQDLAQQRNYEVYFRTILLLPQLVHRLWGGEVVEKMTPQCKQELCEMVEAIGREEGLEYRFILLDNQNLDDRHLNLNLDMLTRLLAGYLEACRRMVTSAEFRGSWAPRQLTLGMSGFYLDQDDLQCIAGALAHVYLQAGNRLDGAARRAVTVQPVEDKVTRLMVSYNEMCVSNTKLTRYMDSPEYVASEVEKLLQQDLLRTVASYCNSTSVGIYHKLFLLDRFLGEVSPCLVEQIDIDSYSRSDDLLAQIYAAAADLLPFWRQKGRLPALDDLRRWRYVHATGKASLTVQEALGEWEMLIAQMEASVGVDSAWEVDTFDEPEEVLSLWQRFLRWIGWTKERPQNIGPDRHELSLNARYRFFMATCTWRYLQGVRERLTGWIDRFEAEHTWASQVLSKPPSTPSPHRLLFSVQTGEQMLEALKRVQDKAFVPDNLCTTLWESLYPKEGGEEDPFAKGLAVAIPKLSSELQRYAYPPESYMADWLQSASENSEQHSMLKRMMEDSIRPFSHFAEGNLGSNVAKHTLLVGEPMGTQHLYRSLSRVVETIFSCRERLDWRLLFLSEYEVGGLQELSQFDVKGIEPEESEEMDGIDGMEVGEIEGMEAIESEESKGIDGMEVPSDVERMEAIGPEEAEYEPADDLLADAEEDEQEPGEEFD
ncbi:MAG: hypothetical protein CSA07_00020 [Bacteroidia bacterium]|nr:MAG: hypothetical protein CSA07_00020 [Bacteroidia bacterium]